MAGSTISTSIAKEVVLIGSGGSYANPLTVTATGRINAPAPATSFQLAAAIYANLDGGSIVNFGVISGTIPTTDTYAAPAIFAATALNLNNSGTITGMSGVDLQDGGVVTNSGFIAGLDARMADGYGVRLVDAQLLNSGTVYGKSYGATGWNASEIINQGSIAGETAGIKLASAYIGNGATLINSGIIQGNTSGVTETSGLIANSGTIDGQTYGIRSNWGGSITNSGHISAGLDGVLLLNEQYVEKYATGFTNSGTIQGGYFAMALNFANVTNTGSGVISGTTFGVGVGDVGYFSNAGYVSGHNGGLVTESGGRAVNAGTVHGFQTGIQQFYNSNVTNAAAGYVTSSNTAVLNQAAYLDNAGTLVGNVYGLELISGGIAVNSGTISSDRAGVYLATLSATSSPDFLGNTGYIYAGNLGINLRNGTVENYGSIRSAQIAVTLVTGASFDNSGHVYGVRYGVQLLGGTVTNSGSIGGNIDGIRLNHGAITNAGTIGGTKYAIYGTSFSLTLDPGAVMRGKVIDKTKASTLDLAGSTPGTLTGLGSTLLNGFSTIDFQPGANWLISGTAAALAAKQPIIGFEQGDTIVITNVIPATIDKFVTGQGLVLVGPGGIVDTLDIVGSFATANFTMTSSGDVSTIRLTNTAPCFAAGTRILTPRGEIAVEALCVGDRVITRSGEDQPILWIGKRTIDVANHPFPLQVQPVCITANALGDNTPRRDLFVSPDHALLVDEMLVPAQLLLNGLNIGQADFARVTYYHVELEAHSVIFAENAPAETYLETGNRNAFENAKGEMMLHPDFSALLRREKSCAKLLLAGAQLDDIRQRSIGRYARQNRRFQGSV